LIFNFFTRGTSRLGKGAKENSVEEIVAIIAYRKAGMKTQEIIACTGRITMNTPRILAASRVLTDKEILQRKKGSGKLRKDTNNILKSLWKKISKYLYMTMGQLRTMVPDMCALSCISV
jgi:hypothetical protein